MYNPLKLKNIFFISNFIYFSCSQNCLFDEMIEDNNIRYPRYEKKLPKSETETINFLLRKICRLKDIGSFEVNLYERNLGKHTSIEDISDSEDDEYEDYEYEKLFSFFKRCGINLNDSNFIISKTIRLLVARRSDARGSLIRKDYKFTSFKGTYDMFSQNSFYLNLEITSEKLKKIKDFHEKLNKIKDNILDISISIFKEVYYIIKDINHLEELYSFYCNNEKIIQNQEYQGICKNIKELKKEILINFHDFTLLFTPLNSAKTIPPDYKMKIEISKILDAVKKLNLKELLINLENFIKICTEMDSLEKWPNISVKFSSLENTKYEDSKRTFSKILYNLLEMRFNNTKKFQKQNSIIDLKTEEDKFKKVIKESESQGLELNRKYIFESDEYIMFVDDENTPYHEYAYLIILDKVNVGTTNYFGVKNRDDPFSKELEKFSLKEQIKNHMEHFCLNKLDISSLKGILKIQVSLKEKEDFEMFIFIPFLIEEIKSCLNENLEIEILFDLKEKSDGKKTETVELLNSLSYTDLSNMSYLIQRAKRKNSRVFDIYIDKYYATKLLYLMIEFSKKNNQENNQENNHLDDDLLHEALKLLDLVD